MLVYTNHAIIFDIFFLSFEQCKEIILPIKNDFDMMYDNGTFIFYITL
jgi:hypothetical protein